MGLFENRVPLYPLVYHHFLLQIAVWGPTNPQPQTPGLCTRTRLEKWKISFGQWSWWLNVRKAGVRCAIPDIVWTPIGGFWLVHGDAVKDLVTKFELPHKNVPKRSRHHFPPFGFQTGLWRTFFDPSAVKGVADYLPSWPIRWFKASRSGVLTYVQYTGYIHTCVDG